VASSARERDLLESCVMRMQLAHMRAVPKREPGTLMPVEMVIDVLQDSVNVALAGVANPGAFTADFMQRQVLPHLRYLRELEASRA
jgi:hypothetical protein